MISVCVLVVVLVAANRPLSVVLKFAVTDVTHSGGSVVFQVTLTPGVEPPTLSARAVTLKDKNSGSVWINMRRLRQIKMVATRITHVV